MVSGASTNGAHDEKRKLEKLKKYFSVSKPLRGIVSFIIALLLFMLIKIFVFEIVKVTGHDMELTFKKGDTFLIKKAGNDYKTNDIIYFTYPEIDSTLPKSWCIQRIIGLPGDTVEISGKRIYLNNYLINDTATLKYNYFIKSTASLDTNFKLRYNLNEGGSISSDFDYSYSLSRANAQQLKNDTLIKNVELKIEQAGTFDETVYPHSPAFDWNMDHFGKFYIPRKHDTLQLDSLNLILYSRLITAYEKNKLEVKKDAVLINNTPVKFYVVRKDYYFVLGDNRDNANDSRVFGLLPANYIKGKVIAILKKED